MPASLRDYENQGRFATTKTKVASRLRIHGSLRKLEKNYRDAIDDAARVARGRFVLTILAYERLTMLMLVTYDVATTTPEGRRRLRRVARVCLNYGQRVQLSVFECSVGDKQLVQLRHDLLEEINPHEDSLRLYNLGENSIARVEHHGQRPSIDFDDALIV